MVERGRVGRGAEPRRWMRGRASSRPGTSNPSSRPSGPARTRSTPARRSSARRSKARARRRRFFRGSTVGTARRCAGVNPYPERIAGGCPLEKETGLMWTGRRTHPAASPRAPRCPSGCAPDRDQGPGEVPGVAGFHRLPHVGRGCHAGPIRVVVSDMDHRDPEIGDGPARSGSRRPAHGRPAARGPEQVVDARSQVLEKEAGDSLRPEAGPGPSAGDRAEKPPGEKPAILPPRPAPARHEQSGQKKPGGGKRGESLERGSGRRGIKIRPMARLGADAPQGQPGESRAEDLPQGGPAGGGRGNADDGRAGALHEKGPGQAR